VLIDEGVGAVERHGANLSARQDAYGGRRIAAHAVPAAVGFDAMADGLLIHADAVRSADMFLATGLATADPYSYIERDGRRIVVTNVLEAETARKGGRADEVWLDDEFGRRELVRGGMDPEQAAHETVRRALERAGVGRAVVPPDFPLALADYLRGHGVELEPVREEFELRRRRKDAAAVEGIRLAQRATEDAFRTAEELLAASSPEGDALVLDGEPVTCERVSEAITATLREHGCEGEPPLVSSGPQIAFVHELGSGPIRPHEPIVIDIFPRHAASRYCADMTRTFCVGQAADEVRHMYRTVEEALRRSTERIAPGVSGRALWEIACDVIEAAGYRTTRSVAPGERLEEDFFHSLGHGVGLDVHEHPHLGLAGEELVPGDVVSVEPGLYRRALGGVRIEDLVLVTEDGHELLTDYHYRFQIA
jgi:Xaa-Pro aminopeptidase